MCPETFTPLSLPRLGGALADAEHERARRRGHQDGFAEGMRAARDEADRESARVSHERRAADEAARGELAAALAALAAATAALSARVTEVVHADDDRVFALAVDLAETILQRELADPVPAALDAARRALGAVEPEAVVLLHPDDLAVVHAAGIDPGDAEFAPGDNLARGDARVQLPDGAVDLRVSAAVARARAALTGDDAW